MRRIGIMGGTFNPVHNGHLTIAERAREQFLLEKVLFLPSGIPYMKNPEDVLPVNIRCEMTALAIADIPYFELSVMEAADAKTGKNTYTYETLEKLKQAEPSAEYYFIMGADSLQAIEQWKNPERIFQSCTILAAVRKAEDCTDESILEPLIRQASYLRKKYNASIEILKLEGIDVSSTKLRKMLREGASVHGFMPKAVEHYILERHLYEKERRIP